MIRWFAFVVDKYLQNQESSELFSGISLLNSSILDRSTNELTPEFLNICKFVPPNEETLNELKLNYNLKLRGKYLFQLYELIFQAREDIKKQSIKDLLSLCFAEGTRISDKKTNMNIIIS